MYVKEINISTILQYVKDTDNLITVKNEMLNDKISAQIVVNSSNEIYGIITNNDLLSVESLKSLKAKDICSTQVLSVSEYDTVQRASMLMVNNNLHHLLVTDKDGGKICGILSSIDIVNYYAQEESI